MADSSNAERPGQRRPRSMWDKLDEPIVLWGTKQTPVRVIAPILLLTAIMIGYVLSRLMDFYNFGWDKDFLFSLFSFNAVAFLTLISLISIFYVFVYQEMTRRREEHKEELIGIAKNLGVSMPKGKVEHSAKDIEILAALRSENLPEQSSLWVGLHLNLKVNESFREYNRQRFERLLFVAGILTLVLLILLPATPIIINLNLLATVVIVFFVVFSLWIVWETLVFIYTVFNILHEKFIVLPMKDGYIMVVRAARDRPPL